MLVNWFTHFKLVCRTISLHRETPLAPKREKGLLPVLVCAKQRRRQTVETPNATAFLSRQKQGCNVSPCSYCLGLEMWFPQHQGGKQQQRKHKLICSTSWANYLFLSSFPFLSVWCGGNTKIFLFVSKRLHSAHISLKFGFTFWSPQCLQSQCVCAWQTISMLLWKWQ